MSLTIVCTQLRTKSDFSFYGGTRHEIHSTAGDSDGESRGKAKGPAKGYPATSVQLCIVRFPRSVPRYVSTEDSKPVANDLNETYQAATMLQAEVRTNVATLFDFPPAIRKVV